MAVQSALDAGEAVGYREIVQRLGRRDRRVAHAALNPMSLRSSGGSAPGAAADGAAGGGGGGAELASKGEMLVELLIGSSMLCVTPLCAAVLSIDCRSSLGISLLSKGLAPMSLARPTSCAKCPAIPRMV